MNARNISQLGISTFLPAASATSSAWIPVASASLAGLLHTGDPVRAVDALHFGESVAPALLERNQDITLVARTRSGPGPRLCS
jgi:hypothetical protein